jgi:hypothetical protein
MLVYQPRQTFLSTGVILYCPDKNFITVTANTLQQFNGVSTFPMGEPVRFN